jgi:hypothetical protein
MPIADLQAECDAAMNVIFDTFQRTHLVTFYKSASEEIVATDSGWNSDFGDPYSQNIVKTSQSKDISCRIWYVDGDILQALDSEDTELKLSYPIARIKIQIKSVDFDWLKDAKCFYIQGNKFVKDSDWRGIGMLQTFNKYEIVLRKSQ